MEKEKLQQGNDILDILKATIELKKQWENHTESIKNQENFGLDNNFFEEQKSDLINIGCEFLGKVEKEIQRLEKLFNEL